MKALHRLTISIVSAVILTMTLASGASASPIAFIASGSFTDGSILGGTISIDTALGTVVSVALNTTGPSAFSFVTIVGQGPAVAATSYVVAATDANATEALNLGIQQQSLIGYAGGPLCSRATTGCGVSNIFSVPALTGPFLLSGALAAAPTAVPEPASAALLGLGAIALLTRRRRRVR